MSRIRSPSFASAALIVLATALAACGGGGNSDADPQSVLDGATLQGIESGDVDVDDQGQCQRQGRRQPGGQPLRPLPGDRRRLRTQARHDGEGQRQDERQRRRLRRRPGAAAEQRLRRLSGDRVRSRPDHLQLRRIDPEAGRSSRAAEESESTGASACQDAAEDLASATSSTTSTNEGSADVDGTDTTKVSGDLNIAGAIDAIIKLNENPACSSQLNAAGPLPLDRNSNAAKDELDKAVKKAHVDVYVGDDDIIRQDRGRAHDRTEGQRPKRSKSTSTCARTASTRSRKSRAPPDAEAARRASS